MSFVKKMLSYYVDDKSEDDDKVPTLVKFSLKSKKPQYVYIGLNDSNDDTIENDVNHFINTEWKDKVVNTYVVNKKVHYPNMMYNMILIFHHRTNKAVGYDPGRGTDFQTTYHCDKILNYQINSLPVTEEDYNELAKDIISKVGLKLLYDTEAHIISNSTFTGKSSFILKLPKKDQVEVKYLGSIDSLELVYKDEDKTYSTRSTIGTWNRICDENNIDAQDDEGNQVLVTGYSTKEELKGFFMVICQLNDSINNLVDKMSKEKLAQVKW